VLKTQEYYQMVLNILCVTQFVMSSITVLQAFWCEKINFSHGKA